jgi:outer membrane usher protein
MTRPVYDSFVIFKPSETFKKYSIGINPEGKSYGALLEGKGNAVLPGFNSYRKGQILLEAIDLPIGYDLGESAYTFMPTYKSGAMVTVGSSAVIYAGGFLTNDSGKPQILSAFIIRSLDDKNREEELFFTNREGYFEIYGLTEGNWMIELVENREYNSTFTIPRGTTGYYELWNVHLQKGEN